MGLDRGEGRGRLGMLGPWQRPSESEFSRPSPRLCSFQHTIAKFSCPAFACANSSRGRHGFLIVFDWQTTETCVLPDRHPRRADFFIRMSGIGWMISDRERKGLAIIETAAPDVYARAPQSSPPHCQKFPQPVGLGGPCCGSHVRQPRPQFILRSFRMISRGSSAYYRPASSVRSGSGAGSAFGRD